MIDRLLDLIDRNWNRFDGWAAAQGFDPERLPLRRLVSVAYYWATMNGDQASIQQFDVKLYMPPKGERATQGPWTPEAETSAFQSLKKAVEG